VERHGHADSRRLLEQSGVKKLPESFKTTLEVMNPENQPDCGEDEWKESGMKERFA